ncbi:uncharacterized protein PgNI_00789 [Pyricularia grisea]|uniref:Uncharacterized protein n=1 Tax=Pyricularia grisea TaxID=148305 RepID=A0A6P8BJL2_PYRGI|nr:uncharacterized protein PgNI_00789 [Pyricularia grisea]TLD16762.1 hypothetical protein PgNI_00789 [Pyricularia grisea]
MSRLCTYIKNLGRDNRVLYKRTNEQYATTKQTSSPPLLCPEPSLNEDQDGSGKLLHEKHMLIMCFPARRIPMHGVFHVSVADPLDSQLAGGKGLYRAIHGRVVEEEEEVGRNTNLIPLTPDQEGQLRDSTCGCESPLVSFTPGLKVSVANAKPDSFPGKPIEEVFGGCLLG